MDDRQANIDRILEHVDHPRHWGRMDQPSAVAEGRTRGCGDVVIIYLRLDAAGQISEATYEGQGCTISQAAASAITDHIIGKTPAEVLALDSAIIAELLGPEVLTNRFKCAGLGLSAAQQAARQLMQRPLSADRPF